MSHDDVIFAVRQHQKNILQLAQERARRSRPTARMKNYNGDGDVIVDTIASQITSLASVYSIV